MTRLSVIVTFFDETAYLSTAIASILSQGVPGVEVIVVNDNPERFPPGTVAAMVPAGVRVIDHAANAGLSAARNSGLAVATGAQVGFLDADDYLVPGGLAAHLGLAETARADITHAQTYVTPAGSVVPAILPRDRALFATPRRGAGLAGIEEAQFITSSWSSLYRRDFLDTFALRFDPEQVRFEDRLFVLSAVTAARSIAVLGEPVRVWRRRAGSISVTPPDAATHRLQVQLLEKCMALMRAHAARPGTPPRFLRRELFNTLSRLIWDMEVIGALAAGGPAIADLGPRIVALLGDDRFGQAIFDDPVLSPIARVGRPSRHGTVRQADFFALHAALRGGAFGDAAAILAARRAAAAAPARRRAAPLRADLVLHLGLHKTGTTAIQHALGANAAALARRGILFPVAGRAPRHDPVRPDGNPGHQALVAALHRDDPAPWDAVLAEAQAARARTVVLSAENLSLPRADDRALLLSRLAAHLARFRSLRVVAFVRRPDALVEAFWREAACNGERGAARGPAAGAIDLAPVLTDLPALFAPFEAMGATVALADHDAAREAGRLWPAFAALAGLGPADGLIPPPRLYPTPHRAEVLAAQAACAMIAAEPLRLRTLRAFFALQAAAPLDLGPDAPLFDPATRRAVIDSFAERSAAWAAARGYAPDLTALRAAADGAWTPPGGLPQPLFDRLLTARILAERPADAAPAPGPAPAAAAPRGEMVLRIRPRPWLATALARLRP